MRLAVGYAAGHQQLAKAMREDLVRTVDAALAILAPPPYKTNTGKVGGWVGRQACRTAGR